MKTISKEAADLIYQQAMRDLQELKISNTQIREEIKSLGEGIKRIEARFIAKKILEEI